MTSIESLDEAEGTSSPRRTRNRFNSVQLMMLENLYHHNSHPSRQDRDTVAKAGNMYATFLLGIYLSLTRRFLRETRSVTIWFQNKRQLERKGPSPTATSSRRSSLNLAPYTFTPTAPKSLAARPSLDQIASRSERPQSTPRTPTRERDPARPIWEAMPSSPPVSMMSPPAKDFVEFGKLTRTRTLEWACAKRRLGIKSGDREEDEDATIVLHKPIFSRTSSSTSTASAVSEKENDRQWGIDSVGNVYPDVEEDMLKAALALCGLGRG